MSYEWFVVFGATAFFAVGPIIILAFIISAVAMLMWPGLSKKFVEACSLAPTTNMGVQEYSRLLYTSKRKVFLCLRAMKVVTEIGAYAALLGLSGFFLSVIFSQLMHASLAVREASIAQASGARYVFASLFVIISLAMIAWLRTKGKTAKSDMKAAKLGLYCFVAMAIFLAQVVCEIIMRFA